MKVVISGWVEEIKFNRKDNTKLTIGLLETTDEDNAKLSALTKKANAVQITFDDGEND